MDSPETQANRTAAKQRCAMACTQAAIGGRNGDAAGRNRGAVGRCESNVGSKVLATMLNVLGGNVTVWLHAQ
jgi:hypothetical protein